MSLSYDRDGTNPRHRVYPPRPVSAKRRRDWLDVVRETADAAFGFGLAGMAVLFLGKVLT